MIDYLLRFESEAVAQLLLSSHVIEGAWRGDILPVALVTADAVFGEPNEDGEPPLISPREVLEGFFLLVPEADFPGQVAAIDRATGQIITGDETLAGAHLDPAWAGAVSPLSLAEPIAEPIPVPAAISRRQFAQQLAILGTISEADALAWAARGDLPAEMTAAVELLPAEERFGAQMLLASAGSYEFEHPLGAQLGLLLEFTEETRRQLWTDAALI